MSDIQMAYQRGYDLGRLHGLQQAELLLSCLSTPERLKEPADKLATTLAELLDHAIRAPAKTDG